MITEIYHMQRHYIIIDCIPYTVYFIPVTHILCNWRLVPFTLLPLLYFCPPTTTSPLAAVWGCRIGPLSLLQSLHVGNEGHSQQEHRFFIPWWPLRLTMLSWVGTSCQDPWSLVEMCPQRWKNKTKPQLWSILLSLRLHLGNSKLEFQFI